MAGPFFSSAFAIDSLRNALQKPFKEMKNARTTEMHLWWALPELCRCNRQPVARAEKSFREIEYARTIELNLWRALPKLCLHNQKPAAFAKAQVAFDRWMRTTSSDTMYS
jgi:hypothetical protein